MILSTMNAKTEIYIQQCPKTESCCLILIPETISILYFTYNTDN